MRYVNLNLAVAAVEICLSKSFILREGGFVKVADLNFGCATFCALPSFDAVTTCSSHTTFSSHKVNVKGSDIDMCSAIYFLFDHNTKYCTIYLCPHTVFATVWLSPRRLGKLVPLLSTPCGTTGKDYCYDGCHWITYYPIN